MPTLPFYVIPRFKAGEVMLFLPDCAATAGNIAVYAHVGQHSEASISYFRGTRRVPPVTKHRNALNALLREYECKLDESEHLEVVHRDRKSFKALRYGLLGNTKTTQHPNFGG